MTTATTIRTRPGLLAALAALLLGLLLVTPGAADAAEGDGSTPPGQAWVRAGHFVPGMGATRIDLTPIGGSAKPAMTASGATYGEVTAYGKVAPGSYTATVRDSSTPMGQAPLLSRALTVTAGEARTIAVLGTADQPRLALLTDDLTPPAAGTARVRLLSASDTAQAVSVQAVGGPTLAQDAVLGETTGYTTVPDGPWGLRLTSASGSDASQTVRLTSGSIYTVVALDSGSGVRLQVVTDAAGAVTTPEGPAATGLGGMADRTSFPDAGDTGDGLALAVALLAAAGLLLPVARRRATLQSVGR